MPASCMCWSYPASSWSVPGAWAGVATVLNVSADHLDRHGNMPAYHQAKHRIFRGCSKAVVNRDDPLTIPLVAPEVEVISWRMREPELGGFGLRSSMGRNASVTALSLCCRLPRCGSAAPQCGQCPGGPGPGYCRGIALAAMLDTLRDFQRIAASL